MRLAFAGFAHSHPFTDAGVARDLGVRRIDGWDAGEPERFAAFRERHECEPAESLAELLGRRPDAVVVTVRPALIADTVARVLRAGVPCFVNKPAAASAAALAELDRAVAGYEERFLTTSVLRFAPAVTELAERIAGRRVLSARALVRHDIAGFLTPERAWQDDPAEGGGTLVSLGLHGAELLDAAAGPGARVLAATGSVLVHPTTRSEDVGAILLGWPDGRVGTIEVAGVGGDEVYEVAVQTEDGVETARLGGTDWQEALGYRATMRAVLAMAAGDPSPVPWPRTRAVLTCATTAATLSRT
ncbi:Gfo/Idh/MocA family protein [Embleya scabrispora]|uniref:Gfo/Idh/MocA family protein n=1 Tax=Embleya scabrispora TaxID=159449 RepID=UPI000378BE2B|nr:Gfo/Idh/MocA family oxidoreductase [Embleya scabrispora]MYS87679.1 Gfo/Idh/MocA family oxidoreductase [Streptomyces sp. SID5474]